MNVVDEVVDPRVVALIPARSGSVRLPGKNTRMLGGHPVLAYTIDSAQRSQIFNRIVVSTDSPEIAQIAQRYGAEAPFLRPPELATSRSPDIEWIQHALQALGLRGEAGEAFSILRPTSPLRGPEPIRQAWAAFLAEPQADSLRAVEPCTQHPGKMWRIFGNRLIPVLPVQPEGTPWHSQATQGLPPVWIQNASLEIAWTRCPLHAGSISGDAIVPFVLEEPEGLDLNDEADWHRLLRLVEEGLVDLPTLTAGP